MTNHAITAAACAALGLLIAQPAAAACSLAAQPIAVKMDAQRPMIDVKINGKLGHFLVDSGAAVNLIGGKFAGSLKLTPTKVSDSGPAIVKAQTFEFAGATLKDAPFVISEKLPDVDGVLGQTILHTGDVEYDLAAFGPNSSPSVKLFKAVGCDGVNMAYWAKEGDIFWEAALTASGKDEPFTRVDVIVNGVKLRGVLSSGKFYTTITQKAAARAGVKPGDTGVQPLGSTGKVWMGSFSSVIIGNEETKSAPLEIDQTDDDFYDLLLGADFLSTHHLYVANSQQKIYFTRAGAPGAPFKVHKAPTIGAIAGGAGDGRLTDHYSPASTNVPNN